MGYRELAQRRLQEHLLDERGRRGGRALMMARRWTESEDTAVRLAAVLDYEDGASVSASLPTVSVGRKRLSGGGRGGCARPSSRATSRDRSAVCVAHRSVDA